MSIQPFFGNRVKSNMLILITYDVNTEDAAGRKRLRQVAKFCVAHGQRVQNSVFECILDATQLRMAKHELLKIIDEENDSIRFYNLGNNYSGKIDHYGIKEGYEAEGNLLF